MLKKRKPWQESLVGLFERRFLTATSKWGSDQDQWSNHVRSWRFIVARSLGDEAQASHDFYHWSCSLRHVEIAVRNCRSIHLTNFDGMFESRESERSFKSFRWDFKRFQSRHSNPSRKRAWKSTKILRARPCFSRSVDSSDIRINVNSSLGLRWRHVKSKHQEQVCQNLKPPAHKRMSLSNIKQ